MPKNVTADGWKKWLDCPSCGEPCKAMPPYHRDAEYPFPHWIDGDMGTCECGCDVRVQADGERAWLIDVSPSPTAA